MKKVCSILMILVILLSVFAMVFAVDNAQNSTGIQKQETVSKVVIIGDKEYHINDPSNVEPIMVNGQNYIKINSYIEKIDNIRDAGLTVIIFLGIVLILISTVVFILNF